METITLDFKNYEQISLCCCDEISEPIKKKWLQNHMQDGVVYRRSAEDASFMEYMPGKTHGALWKPRKSCLFISSMWIKTRKLPRLL